MRHQANIPVLIAGAGPTGLVLALWLTRLGIAVRVIDGAAEPGTTSRALAVQARTLEFYRQVGIADAVTKGGVQVPALNLWVRGTLAATVPLRTMEERLSPFPFPLIYPQDEHEKLLIETLSTLGVQVERRTELAGFSRYSDGVRATIRRPDGSEEMCEAAFLAGCDGAHSTVREVLGIDFPGGTYAGLFYVADVDAAGPAANDEIHVDIDDSDFLAVFPMKGSSRVRLIGTLREDPGRELTFDDINDRAIRQLKFTIQKVNWFSTYRVHHRVAKSFRSGRVFLLGDAAHIHSPVGGQGMNTGIGDAVNLSWKLAAVLNGRGAESLLDTYEPERIGFARRLVATTDRVFTFITRQGPIAKRVRTRLVPAVLPVLFKFSLPRRFLFRTVSQIGIRYRNSPLSEGRAGAVHAGDRLPWIRTGPGGDNFTPLSSLSWQVHIYGELRPRLADTCAELGLPIHVFTWTTEMHRAGLARGALYLVRPDGYVGLADPDADPERLRQYFIRLRLAESHGAGER